MSKWVVVCLTLASTGWAVDLTKYPYESTVKPLAFESLSAEELARTKPIPTDYIEFLFVSPCDAEGKGSDQCLWALVNTLFPARVALQGGGKSFTLHYVRFSPDPKFDETKSHQFILVTKLPADAVKVNDKDLMVTQWARVEGFDLAVPLLWVPVTDENQKRMSGQYYQGLRTSPGKEIRLVYSDLVAGKTSPGEAFFVVLGFSVADTKASNEYFVARRHASEPNTFTAVLTRVRYGDGTPKQFDWKGYTFSTVSDAPDKFESLMFESKQSLRGEVRN